MYSTTISPIPNLSINFVYKIQDLSTDTQDVIQLVRWLMNYELFLYPLHFEEKNSQNKKILSTIKTSKMEKISRTQKPTKTAN